MQQHTLQFLLIRDGYTHSTNPFLFNLMVMMMIATMVMMMMVMMMAMLMICMMMLLVWIMMLMAMMMAMTTMTMTNCVVSEVFESQDAKQTKHIEFPKCSGTREV
jgi:hypothetical protein